MHSTQQTWDPASPVAWARALGLVHVPLFGLPSGSTRWPGECAVLLDGQQSSFAVCSIPSGGVENGEDLPHDRGPVAWSWSSCLRHVLILNPAKNDMYLRRWDAPEEYRRFEMPDSPRRAEKLLPRLVQTPALTAVDAILHSLRFFRQLRMSLPLRNALDAIRIFNAFLLGVDAVRSGRLDASCWSRCTCVNDALSALRSSGSDVEQATGTAELEQASLNANIGDLLERFLAPEPTTEFELEPGLLLRHAAGQLYQEAHIVIERDNQLYLPGLAPDARPKGRARSDVHFTPISVARFLVQEAFAERARSEACLTVLDPACGSGVFLLEALRELQSRGFKGRVRLRGLDISAISCAMARFCLARSRREAIPAGIDADISIEQADALEVDWGQPDVVLMNPPFASLEGMDQHDRDAVRQVLGVIGQGRVDKAMAFIWKAVRCLAPAGVLASLLPAPLFETRAGVRWREAIANESELRFLGRLRGYGYFRDAAVEPGVVIVARPQSLAVRPSRPVRLLLADEGRQDEAIRGSRRYRQLGGPSRGEGWEVSEAARAVVSDSWMPRSGRQLRWMDALSQSGVPTVGELFLVHQGIRTGLNRAFVLAEGDIEELPRGERSFFRPVASNSTIGEGVIHPREFVFYPYDEHGLTLTTEDEVRREVPTYYERWLEPQHEELMGRSRARASQWWVLTEETRWQRGRQPKLASKYFGETGGFGYDESGEFVVLQGYGWLWRGDRRAPSRDAFFDSPLPFAYLALLNSPLFQALVGYYCPRVRGGQCDLSPRFINKVFLPDLADDLAVSSDTVSSLAALGSRIHEGTMPDLSTLKEAAALAYPIPGDEVDELVAAGVR